MYLTQAGRPTSARRCSHKDRVRVQIVRDRFVVVETLLDPVSWFCYCKVWNEVADTLSHRIDSQEDSYT
jgi:hypothetical protein